MTVKMVWRAGVFSESGVVMIGSVAVTTLHPGGGGGEGSIGTPGA
jgi:hypothetical protein